MNIRIKDIAKKAGVSAGTVDRVLHNRGEVSEKTKEKVFSITKELDYTPDILARTLAKKNKYTFATLLPETSQNSSYWDFPKSGIEKALLELSHFKITLKNFTFNLNDNASFVKKFKKLLTDNIDAILTVPLFSNETITLIKACQIKKIPYVFIDSNLAEANPLSYIGQNAYQSGQLAAHLMSLTILTSGNLLIITFAKDPDNILYLSKRTDGFKDFFKRKADFKNISLKEVFIHETLEKSINRALYKSINNETQGIFVPNSRVFRIANFLNQSHIKNIKVIGYDLIPANIEFLKKGYIDFIISQRPEEQGYRGIMTLYNHLLLNKEVEPLQYLPIDILTKENIEFYNY